MILIWNPMCILTVALLSIIFTVAQRPGRGCSFVRMHMYVSVCLT